MPGERCAERRFVVELEASHADALSGEVRARARSAA